MASGAQSATDTPAEHKELTYWEWFLEWLLPAATFEKSKTPKRDLLYARILLVLFYLALTGVAIYTIVRLCWSGRIELFTSLYKVDFVEAPSLAFCPFNPNDTVTGDPMLSVIKYELHGSHSLNVTPRSCSFDRHCCCVDLNAYRLRDSATSTEPAMIGREAMVFHESINVTTNLSDPSPDHILKVGIYDSHDKAPDWFYVNQGAVFVGQLELTIWYIMDISIDGLLKTLMGDLRAMVKTRNIWKYTSQEVGDHSRQHLTSVKYEMKTYFVEETMSSHRAFSLYTVGVIFALIALRWVVVDAFFHTIIPLYEEKAEKTEVRQLSPLAITMRNFLCCCIIDDSERPEREPLIGGKSQASNP